ncbi:MAG: M56 family metallopeptidase [Planctomycetota bacterium]|jgi:beta-lactamase regulating signal transducer with metallopeptidase domain
MTDLLLQIGVSNLCIALALALVAWVVQRTGKFPRAAHLLWLLVLVKLVTPSIVTVPVIALPGPPVAVAASDPDEVGATAVPDREAADAVVPATATASSSPERGTTGLAILWLLGSALILSWSLVRVVRFHHLLSRASEVAPAELQRVASAIAKRLGLSTTPTIYSTLARVSPLVWWVGGRVRVVIPADLTREMDAGQVESILAHELAHVRRRDHQARWIEWLACVLCWWNPVAWWARRNLRTNEEVCCDALVLESLIPNPRTYANSLLTVVEFLSAPALRPPAMASGIVSGGSLERRFKMILSAKPLARTPRWLRALALLSALALLPLGIAQAQEPDGDKAKPTREEIAEMGREIREDVAAGVITKEEGRARMRAYLERFGGGEKRMTREDYARLEAEIKKAVEEGKLTGEEGRKKLAGLRRRMANHRKGPSREEMAAYKKKLADAVATGEITEEEAKAKWESYLKFCRELQGDRKARPSREEMGRVKEEIWAAVKAGKITEEQAEERWQGYLRRVRGGMPSKEEMAKVKAEIWAGVKAGKISEEGAQKRWEAYLKRFKRGEAKERGRRGKPTREEMAAVKERIWAGVRAGRISEEAAQKRWEGYLKSLKDP